MPPLDWKDLRLRRVIAGAADPRLWRMPNQMITPFFLNDGATSLLSNTLTGASWYMC